MQIQRWGRLGWLAMCVALCGVAVLVTGCPTPSDGGGSGRPLDADSDGVVNDDDLCPNTAAGATVDADGCADSQKDADGDGVNDDADQCPDTPDGSPVDADGCPTASGNDDDDNDGVVNADDDCPGTLVGATVDANGCSPRQRDTDNDGVTDNLDQCPNTPANVDVNSVGCPIGNPTGDDDNDGIANADDECPNTPANATVDAEGCTNNQRDDDGDGVLNGSDQCAATPADADVDANGCAASQRDTDGDGVLDALDLCPNTTPGTTVDNTGCRSNTGGGGGGGGGSAVCGNGAIEPGEQCEPPNTETCDALCQLVTPPQELNADQCANAVVLEGEGTFVFDNTSATMDGPSHTGCVSFGSDQIDHDVWGRWTSPCTGTVFVRTCGLTAVDTKLAVYAGTTCPPTDGGLLDCNDDACSSQAVQSLVTFEAVSGQSYLVRLGTFPGEPGGVGGVSITCGLSTCPGEGACFEANGTPGCNDESCCERTCEVDPFCCDSQWDDVCAREAQGLCTGSFSTCGGRTGSCSNPDGNGTPRCSDTDCCNAVCQEDPFCCLQEWDNVCATLEASICHTTCGSPDAGECSAVHATPGCNSDACCAEVCSRDPVCCQSGWDQDCVDLANQHCQ